MPPILSRSSRASPRERTSDIDVSSRPHCAVRAVKTRRIRRAPPPMVSVVPDLAPHGARQPPRSARRSTAQQGTRTLRPFAGAGARGEPRDQWKTPTASVRAESATSGTRTAPGRAGRSRCPIGMGPARTAHQRPDHPSAPPPHRRRTDRTAPAARDARPLYTCK
jgi:hypothetical protein